MTWTGKGFLNKDLLLHF